MPKRPSKEITLAEAIGQLSQPQVLDLSNNQLSTLPEAVLGR
jgi:Leucine-rich repeat (LRR) protein